MWQHEAKVIAEHTKQYVITRHRLYFPNFDNASSTSIYQSTILQRNGFWNNVIRIGSGQLRHHQHTSRHIYPEQIFAPNVRW